MDTANNRVKELETINSKILDMARFVNALLYQLLYLLYTCRRKALPQHFQSSDNIGNQFSCTDIDKQANNLLTLQSDSP